MEVSAERDAPGASDVLCIKAPLFRFIFTYRRGVSLQNIYPLVVGSGVWAQGVISYRRD